MNKSDLHYAKIIDIAPLIQSKELSPVELTEHMLARIEALDGRLNSYATITAERARDAALRAEADIASGNYRGPLHGVPLAVKDLCYTRSTATMGGLSVRSDFIPDHDATVIQRLEAAGAVLLGKVNLTEGAMVGYHPDFKIPVNPWAETLWPGASSSGSGVAVAAGLCYAALGSDTGGSIRFPAMANGVVGLKPTYGRVSRHGVLDLGETLDHVGPLCRGVEDAALVMAAMSGRDEADPTSLIAPPPDFSDISAGVVGLRIGYDRDFARQGSDPALIVSIEKALSKMTDLGATLVDITVPSEALTLTELWFVICSFEAHKAHAATYPSRRQDYGNYFRDFLDLGAAISEKEYGEAMAARRSFSERYETELAKVDAMVCPAGGVPFTVNADQYGGIEVLAPLFEHIQMHFTIPDDFAGTPTLTLPCGAADNGVPYSLQLVGRKLAEPVLCLIGCAYEAASGWHERHPPLA
jgi:amidase